MLEKTPESPLDSKEINQSITLNIYWKNWCWSSSILVIGCEQTTHWKSPWCLKRLRAEGEEGVREWDSWMALLIEWNEPGQTSRDGEGQRDLASCSPRDRKDSDTTGTGRLNNNHNQPKCPISLFSVRWLHNFNVNVAVFILVPFGLKNKKKNKQKKKTKQVHSLRTVLWKHAFINVVIIWCKWT